MSEASPAEPMPETDPALGADQLHPADRAFLAQKFAGGPLIFGLISVVSSVIILGMIPGALGLRAGIDLWQRGVRRGVVVAGVVTSFVGVAASILCALLWGSILAGVLLGRDAMRETERWRGEVLEPFSLTAIESISGDTFSFEIPPKDDRVERVVLLLAGVGETPSAEAISTAVRVAERHPQCRLLVVTPLAARDDGKAFATIASASTLEKEVQDEIAKLAKQAEGGASSTKSVIAARAVGIVLANRSKAAKVDKVVFDRNGFLYTGRVKALADAARETGLVF